MVGPPVKIGEEVPRELREAIYSMYNRCSWIVEFLEEIIIYHKIKRKEKGFDPERADATIGETYTTVIIDENTFYRIPVRMPPNLARFVSMAIGFMFRPVPYDPEIGVVQSFLFMIKTMKALIDEFTLVALSRPSSFAYMVMQVSGGYSGKYADLAAALNKVPVSRKIELINEVGDACVKYKDMNLVEYLKEKIEEVSGGLEGYTVYEYFSEGLWKNYDLFPESYYVAVHNPVSITAINNIARLVEELERQNIGISAEGVRNHYMTLLSILIT